MGRTHPSLISYFTVDPMVALAAKSKIMAQHQGISCESEVKGAVDLKRNDVAKIEAAKSIIDVMPATRPHWVGDGFHVYPVFSDLAFTQEVSPFLMLDYAAPKAFPPSRGAKRGVGKHPHRGFETVTIAFQGEVEHADSVGNRDVIGAGDFQWMTAGAGIVHEEFHSTNFRNSGGTFEMIQLWVNLPADKKMTPPTYQPILKDDIPEVPINANVNGGSVRVLAGNFKGTKGPAKTHSPIDLWDVQLPVKGSDFTFDVPNGHNTMIFVRSGSITVSGSSVGPQGMVRLDTEGTRVSLQSTDDDTKLVVLAGEPLNEPIAAQGPFVMNTWDEIRQANIDYSRGLFSNDSQ